MTWSAKQYTLFEDERTRPVRDLLAAVPTQPVRTAMDLGCGPGNSTEVLRDRFPDAAIGGLDSSADMVAAARTRLPGLRFDVADLAAWRPAERYDLLLSNAVLQWLPDHAGLLPRLVEALAPGGSLAVQMPDNLDEPVQRAMRDVAGQAPWAAKLAQAAGQRTAMASADWFYRLLRPHCSRVDIWRTTYHHVLPGGHAGVVEWFKGSGLRPFLAPLDPGEATAYLERYQSMVAAELPAQPDGSVLLPFPRLFFVATR